MYNFLKGRLVAVRLTLLVTAGLLVGIGIVTIYSVGHPAESSPAGPGGELAVYWKKQVIFFVIGMGGFIFVNSINYRRFGQSTMAQNTAHSLVAQS